MSLGFTVLVNQQTASQIVNHTGIVSVLLIMLAVVFFLSLRNSIPVASYAMPELCKLLSTATGTVHRVDPALSDYPLFVSVKSGDPARVESLVAEALHGTWIDEGPQRVLKQTKTTKDEGFDEFQRLYIEACKGDPIRLRLPIHDMYDMGPGENLRFSATPRDFVKQLPLTKGATTNPPNMIVRRFCYGMFEFGLGQPDFTFRGLPAEVKTLIGDDLTKPAVSDEQLNAINERMGKVMNLKISWFDADHKDPVADLQALLLGPIASQIKPDFVVALPDFTLFALLDPSAKKTVSEILDKYAMAVRWVVKDGAVVGCLTSYDVNHSPQAKRDVLSNFVQTVAKQGVVSVVALGQYVSAQRPNASNSWIDASLLVMSGTVIDQAYIADYPFNVRLYSGLDKDDWALINGKRPFLMSELSAESQKNVETLLLQSRARMEDKKSDPAYWQTLEPNQLTITPSFEEEQVLIGFTMIGGEVATVSSSATNYDMRRKSLDHEPLYQPATRRHIKIRIATSSNGESVETGFTDVTAGSSKPAIWSQLPSGILTEFKNALTQYRQLRQPNRGQQPPP